MRKLPDSARDGGAIAAARLGAFYVVSSIILWSSLGVFVRLSGAQVHEFIFYSNAVSLVPLGLIYLTRVKPAGDIRMMPLLILGPLSLLNTFTFFYAYKNTTFANAVLTHYIAPVIVAISAPLVLKEKTSKSAVLSLILACAGLWFLIGRSAASLSLRGESLGIASGLFSGVMYAVIILVFRVYARRYDPVLLTLSQNLIICLMLWPFISDFPVGAFPIFIAVGILHSTAAPLLYFKGLQAVPAVRAALLGYLEPVGAVALGAIFFGEYPGAGVFLGGALILLSGYLSLRDGRGQG